jgi:hypothetical protein
VIYPNPSDGSKPLSFYHTVPTNTSKVELKIFTLALRKIYDDSTLDSTTGQHLYSVDWNKVGSVANGVYYFVIVDQSAAPHPTLMKVLYVR